MPPQSLQPVHIDTALTRTQAGSSDGCLVLTGLPDACNTPADFRANYGLQDLYQGGATGSGDTIAIVTLAMVEPGAPQYDWANVLSPPPPAQSP